jgi:hypothetical protein
MDKMRRKGFSWELKVALWLGSASLILYLIDFACFRDWYSLSASSLANLAFLPISVMVVTLIIDRLLSARDREMRLEKINMLVSAFFANLGAKLLTIFASRDEQSQYLQDHFGNPDAWDRMRVREAHRLLAAHSYEVALTATDLKELREFLSQKGDYLLRLLENPNLHEHERFTELLRAIFHLAEELSFREDISKLPDSDRNHLAGDLNRCYGPLVREWVHHMWHLKSHYPYLFSLAIRTNPFDRSASPIVK